MKPATILTSVSLALLGIADALNEFGGNVPIIKSIPQDVKKVLGASLSDKADVAIPGEDLYGDLTIKYSDFNRHTFAAVVAVASVQDVVETVNYARANNIPFLVQSGGHSLTTSTQVMQNAIQINMRRLNHVVFDKSHTFATVGGGTLTGEFTNVTHEHGREVTVGSCPCTGVMGIGLGAGIGRLQGTYGYFMDNILELTFVLYDGTVKRLSPTENTDLWWDPGCRSCTGRA